MDYFHDMWSVFGQHKTRTLLTGFGVFWGIFLLVLLMGVGQGLKNGVVAQFGGTADTVYIWRANVTQTPYKGFNAGRWVGMDDKDLNALKKEISGLKTAIGVNQVGGWVSPQYVVRLGVSNKYIIQGSHPEVSYMNGFSVIKGRFINRIDNEKKRKIAVIGKSVYLNMFSEGENPIGKMIEIAGIPFVVVGVFEPETIGLQFSKDSKLVLIPNSTLRYSYNQVSWINLIRLSPEDGISSSYIESRAIEVLKNNWSIHPDDHGVYGSYNTQVAFDRFQSLFNGINIFSWLVAFGTVLAGAIGVGNVMLVIVKERTKEIGVRKAIGATVESIVFMVVKEAVFLTALSGCLGLIVGLGGLKVIAYISRIASISPDVFLNPSIDINTGIYAVIVLVFTGVVSSLIPAFNAARVDPIVALNDE